MKNGKLISFLCLHFTLAITCFAQSKMETGGQKMPDEWIDASTGHKVINLTRREGNNYSFYFHNNPFIGNRSDGYRMIFYGTDFLNTSKNDSVKVEISNVTTGNKQIYSVDLETLKIEQITNQHSGMNGEIIGPKNKLVYYQIKDSVFATHIETKQTRLVYVFPADFKAGITTLNADETLLAGAWSSDAEKEIFRKNPDKSSYFNLIYEAKLPRTLFTINVKTGELIKLFSDSAWLNHVQFSNTDPKLLMFCHEGPWHKVDRIWTIDITTKQVKKMHQRTMDMEIFGHEWFAPDGKRIWFDLQQPRSTTFFIAGTDVRTGQEIKYALKRDEWSIHFNTSPDQKLFCGDGGDPGQVAKAKDGRWIYLFTPSGDSIISERLVNMKNHNYKTEPNVHFSPDGKWVIFRATFEGHTDVYAVEVRRSQQAVVSSQ
jgi:oligogalacturonide lyase